MIPIAHSPLMAPALHFIDLLRHGGEVRRGELVLITGHPRSGTHFTAKMLRRMGYSASIEGRWMSGHTRFVSSWKHAQPGWFRNRFYARDMRQDFGKILHQVRHPLDVIASSTTLVDRTVDHIRKYIHLPEATVNYEQPLSLCMRSWIGWNQLIEERASWRFQLEELQDVFPQFCREIGIPETQCPDLGAQNCRKHQSLTWDDLEYEDLALADQVRKMAHRYGYDVA